MVIDALAVNKYHALCSHYGDSTGTKTTGKSVIKVEETGTWSVDATLVVDDAIYQAKYSSVPL